MSNSIFNRRGFLASLAVTAVALAGGSAETVNKSRKGIAVKGYDVVGYFRDSRPVKGTEEFRADWMGATFLFASAENRELFNKEPEKYAPQFGGYCAWAVGHGQTADIDPEAWKVVNGHLYLNYSKSVQSKWSADTEKWITEAEKNWPRLHK